MAANGRVRRLTRGLHQLADAPIGEQHTLAEASKRVPKAIVRLTSALAFHGLTDHHSRCVWLAIGFKDWAPKLEAPVIRLLGLTDTLLAADVQHATIEDVT